LPSSGSGPRSRWFLQIGAVALLFTSACTGSPSATPTELEGGALVAEVEFIVDGDTLDLIIDGQEERVRLIGIDTPETKSESVPVQCYGQEAADALAGLLPVGSEVQIQRDTEPRDRFGRLLLYVTRATDGLNVNRWLVEQGFADVLFLEPNTTFESEFVGVRNEARAQGRGLWSACDGPDQPLE